MPSARTSGLPRDMARMGQGRGNLPSEACKLRYQTQLTNK